MDWPLVGRRSEFSELRSALSRGPGAVVAGPAGIGKTRLLAEVVDPRVQAVRWVPVTADAATVPFGPLLPVFPELRDTLSSGAPAVPFAVLRESLEELGGKRPLLVVDDAHLLDPASAGVVHQLAVVAGVRVAVTVRTGVPVPDAVTALWKDGGLRRMELAPLPRADADTLCLAILDGQADARTLATLWRLSRGNPLELREVILSAHETGALARPDGVWRLADRLTPTSRLVELVDGRLARLSDEEREAAELLAYSEPLDVRLLHALVEPGVLEQLERANVVVIGPEDASPRVATLAHPLYGEVLRAALPSVRRTHLAGRLVREAGRLPAADVDPLRVATWQLTSGEASAGELAAAARAAVGRMAFDLAVRLGRASLERQESYQAHTAVGAALAELGEAALAEQHLRRAEELAESPLLAAWAVMSRADVWFFHAGRPEDAMALLRAEIAEASDPEVREDLTAGLAVQLMMYGDLPEVAGVARDVLAREGSSDRARLLALVAVGLADGVALRLPAVAAAVAAARPLVEPNRPRLPNAEDLLEGNLYIADLCAGDLAAARQRVDERRRLAIEAGDPAFWSFIHAQLLLYEGRAQASHDAAREALRLLDAFDAALSRPLALLEAAFSAAVLGRPDDARRYLDAVPELLRSTPRVRARHDQVAAYLAVVASGLDAAARDLAAAGDRASDDGVLAWAAEAWHIAVRLGRAEPVADRLADLADATEAGLVELYADHATALAAADPSRLEDVARRFHARGFGLFAAEAAAQACGVHRRGGRVARSRQAAVLARELLPSDSGAATPALAELADAPPLTPREREIALLAASGLTSREIAERLSLSVRTVDNRLASVYSKLAITGRSELPDAFLVGPSAADGTRSALE